MHFVSGMSTAAQARVSDPRTLRDRGLRTGANELAGLG